MISVPPPLPPMKRGLSFLDKLVLWLSLGLVGALVLGALGWAAVRNIQADNARIEREEGERVEAVARPAGVMMAEGARPSAWDGSVEVVKALVRMSANDPEGVKYHSWKTMSMGEDQQVTVVDFTVRNAFGGPVRHVWRVMLDPRDGRVKGLHDGERWVIDPSGT